MFGLAVGLLFARAFVSDLDPVIGAGSVVTNDIPEDVFAAGNPCRLIRHLND